MLFWRRWRRPCRDLTGPATPHRPQPGAYTAPWHNQPTRAVSTVGRLTCGQAAGYTTPSRTTGSTTGGTR
jgi:hypothetical protein